MTAVTIHPVDLDPGRVADGTYTTRRRGGLDPTALIVLMLVLLCVIPAGLIVPGMTDIGRPAQLVSLLLCAWWVAGRIHPALAMRGPQPLRWAVGFFLISALISYGLGYLRGLTLIEANASDMEMLKTLAMIGVILMTADGISTRERLDRALQVLVWLCGFMGLIGIIQFASGYDITQNIIIPGLEYKRDLTGFASRGDGLFRVPSTALHYIEFSAAMAMVVPYAMHYTRFGETRGRRQLAAISGVLAASAIPLTLSRTGILAAGVALICVLPALPWRIRANVLVVLAFGTAAFMVIRPGLLGTLKSLFLGASNDPSIQGRTDDYEQVAQYFSERPWFGRGTGTFVPQAYRILDNEWLFYLMTNGLVGVFALLALHVVAISLAVIAMRRSTSEADRQLCAALISTQFVSMLVGLTFDSLGFITYATMWFVLTGAAGAMWRLTHPSRQISTATPHEQFTGEFPVVTLDGPGAPAIGAAPDAKPALPSKPTESPG